jgi:hypothetical protein
MEVSSQLDIPAASITGKTYCLVKKVEGLESRLLLAGENTVPPLLEMEP